MSSPRRQVDDNARLALLLADCPHFKEGAAPLSVEDWPDAEDRARVDEETKGGE
jgi:hypothetical protein